jgi:hypothetical protein
MQRFSLICDTAMYTLLVDTITRIVDRVYSGNRLSMERLSALSAREGDEQSAVISRKQENPRPLRTVQDQARAALVAAIAEGELSLYAHFRGNSITGEPPDDGRKLVPKLTFQQVQRALNRFRPGPSSGATCRRLFHSDLWCITEEIERWLKGNLPELPASSRAEIEAIDFLACRMTPETTRENAKKILAEIDYSFAKTGDKSDRVWFAARERAGFPRKGRPGRPRKKIEAN